MEVGIDCRVIREETKQLVRLGPVLGGAEDGEGTVEAVLQGGAPPAAHQVEDVLPGPISAALAHVVARGGSVKAHRTLRGRGEGQILRYHRVAKTYYNFNFQSCQPFLWKRSLKHNVIFQPIEQEVLGILEKHESQLSNGGQI